MQQPNKGLQKSIKDLKILKFRSFVSKQQQGFVFIYDHPLPQVVFEDLLYQLFQPIFQQLPCPDIYYFSSTDQTLSHEQMINMKDYVYVHFLQRVNSDQKLQRYSQKFKITDIDQLSKGISFDGINLYVISQKYYMMYKHDLFYQNIEKKITELPLKIDRKQSKYEEFFKQLVEFQDNMIFLRLKKELKITMDDVNEKLKNLYDVSNRYAKARTTITNILKDSGIQIRGLSDL